MSEGKEYKVGEIFRHDGFTYQCVVDSEENGYCGKCQLCDEKILCDKDYRADKRNVHFIRVTEPQDGMMFRASDGNLYRLFIDIDPFDYGSCACDNHGLTCIEIFNQAFPDSCIFETEHWELIEENKEDDEKMNEIKRHLELAVEKVDGDQVTFRIVEQTHRGKDFTPNGEKFKSSCGYFLIVDTYPGFRDDYTGKILFVRGYDSAEDDTKTTVPLLHFAKIMESVNEYNETDGKSYEKPWPQDGDKYFCINSTGFISYTNYDNHPIDNDRREFGNFFRTREEAEAALERVKEALKGE